MKLLIIEGPGRSRVREIEIPAPGPGEVLIRMKYCGICSSELEPWKTAFPGQEFGHEPIGTIEALGDGVTGFALHDRAFQPLLRPVYGYESGALCSHTGWKWLTRMPWKKPSAVPGGPLLQAGSGS